MMSSRTSRVLGIDLSGRTTGRTALAVATGNADGVEAEFVRSSGDTPLPRRPALRRLAAIAVDLDVDLVAIDAPLTLPHVWTCEREDCDECFPADGDNPV